ncbi:MAG: zf-HC2 domain-containing protein [Armatimonadota bacterium]
MSKMKCEEVQPILLDYGMGRVSGTEAQQVRDHLERCRDCEALLREEVAFAARLSAVPLEVPRNDVWALIRARTRPRILSPFAWLGRIRGAKVFVKRATAVAAVFCVAAVALYSTKLHDKDFKSISSEKAGVGSVITVKWSDDPLGAHREALVECIDGM